MRKHAKLFKQAQSWVLAVAIIVSLFTPMLSLTSSAQTNEKTKTDGQIVADNYAGLSPEEKALIGSGLLIGETHTYQVPGASDDLIDVDTDHQKIVADSYEGTDGYVFKPISAKIVVDNDVKETVTLTDGEGSYEYDGNAFSVRVEYVLDVTIDADVQNTLLNAPGYFVDGLSGIDAVVAQDGNLEIFSRDEVQNILFQMATSNYLAPAYGTYVPVYLVSTDAKNAVLALNSQIKSNGQLNLAGLIDAYQSANSKVQFLVENGASFRAEALQTKAYLEAILADSVWWIKDHDTSVKLFWDAMNALVNILNAECVDEWPATTTKLVKDGISDAEYKTLDELVSKIGAVTDVSDVLIKNPLRVETVTIQHNLSMNDVSVSVVLKTTQNNVVAQFGNATTVTVTLPTGATAADVLSAIEESGVEADAIAYWDKAYVAGKFESETVGVPDTLTEDVSVTVTYTPKYYDVTFDYTDDASYPYGYVITFDNHADVSQAYDYTVNGQYYAQGSSYTVEGDTNITREVGKAYTPGDLYQIVSDNYLSGKGASILTSGAILGNVEINVRYPDNSGKIVALNGNTLTAKPFDSSYKGLQWTPSLYTLEDGTTGEFTYNGGVYEAELSNFETVKVTYCLNLMRNNVISKDTVLAATNIPHVLNEEAKDQLAALESMAGLNDSLALLTGNNVDIFTSLIGSATLHSDPAVNTALKDNFTDVLAKIKTRQTEGQLNLARYISEYAAAQDGLLYYYSNSKAIISEVNEFSALMTQMLGDDGNALLSKDMKQQALKDLMDTYGSGFLSAEQLEKYKSKLPELEDKMKQLSENLKAPNEAIDLNSSNLYVLTAALQESGDTREFSAVEIGTLLLEDSSMPALTSNEKVALSVVIKVEGGKTVTVTSKAFVKTKEITQNDIAELKGAVEAAYSSLLIAGALYDNNYNSGVELDALVGMTAGAISKTVYEYSWTYSVFSVDVPMVGSQNVSYKNPVITFATSADPAYRYDYSINGVKVNGTSYTLSPAELNSVANGTFKVTFESVFVLEENLINYVNELNASLDSDVAVFALVKDAKGDYSIVLKIDAAQPDALMGAVQGIAMGIAQGNYPYVGIDGNGFFADGKISLQCLIDALTNSGFGSETILKMMDANGNINHININGNIISNQAVAPWGGLLMETSMQLGSSAASVTDLPFYVTLGSVSSELVQVRNAFAGDLGKFFGFECSNGAFGLKLNLPEKAYEAFLAVLLITEKIDITDINAVNGEIAISFFNEMLIPLFKGDITVETFENTLAKFGANYDLSSQKGAETLFSYLKNFYTGATFTYGADNGTATGTVSIKSFVDSMDLGALGGLIAEYESGLEIGIDIALEDLGTDYEALFVDVNASGVANKIGLTTDLSAKLNDISGTSVIVLLKDISDDLVINTTTLLNLNGFTVDANLTANGKTIVVDSYVNDDKVGTVTGKLSGNLTLVAGKYTDDATNFVKNGFVQGNDGIVNNKFYSIDEDANGNLVVSINAGLIHTNELPDVTGLALDLACDLLFNGYSSNYLELDGNTIYDITLNELIGLYTSSNRLDSVIDEALGMIDSAELSTFINTVLDDVMDFAAISEAIAKNEPIVSYPMITKPWAVEFLHITDGNYIDTSIVSGSPATERTLQVKLVGDDADKKYFEDLFAELGNTVDSDVNVNIAHGKNDLNIFVNAEANVNVTVDWSNPNYGIMFSIIVADGIGAPANAKLVAAIRSYYETGDIDALSVAFNSLTTAQVITALKNVAKDDSFTAMISALGLADVVSADVVTLEALYDKIGKIAAFAVRKADLVGGSRTLSSYLGANGFYDMSRENVERLFNRGLFRGYTISVDVAITDFYFGLKLFDTVPAPEFVDDHGNATVGTSDLLFGSRVDLDKQMIILDTVASGVTVAQLKALLNLETINATSVELVFMVGETVLADTDLVPNGTKVIATAVSTATKQTDTTEYTIVILGDTNCDGRIAIGDAVQIANNIVGNNTFSELQNLAADTNNNTRIDIGDAVRIAIKITDSANYTSLIVVGQ